LLFPLVQKDLKGFACDVDALNKIVRFYSPSDVRKPFILDKATGTPISSRTYTAVIPTTPQRGETLVMSNVISFQVQVIKSVPSTGTTSPQMLDIPISGLIPGTPPAVIDTGVFTAIPTVPQPPGLVTYSPNPPFSGISVTIRNWDPSSKQTRQVTLIQDL
jgi:hypothetical protein